MSDSDKAGSGFYGGCLCGTLIATILFAAYMRYQNQASGLLGGGLANEVVAQEVIKLKLAHGLDPTHPVHAGMLQMQSKLAEISAGKVLLEIYPSGQLGNETQCIEQLQNGALAMTKTSAAPMEGFVPAMAMVGMGLRTILVRICNA